MDPVTLIAAAVAAGAVAGVGETTAQVVKDGYAGLKGLLTRRYAVVEAEVVGVEFDPEEPLRRQLLAKQLAKAGAGEDEQVRTAALELLRLIAEHTPRVAETFGVRLVGVGAGGDIEISDVEVTGGATGVSAHDVSAGGSIRISGVRAGSGSEQDPTGTSR